MTKLTKEEQWRSHIEACTCSGMNAKAWCKANDIIPHNHYWKRKFKAAYTRLLQRSASGANESTG